MSKKKKKLLSYVVVLALAFLALFVSPLILEPFKMQVVDLASLPMKIVLFPFREAKKLLFYHVTYDQYMKLKDEAGVLKGRLINQEELARENQRLRELLNFRKSLVFSSVPANVVGRDPSNWKSTMIIDKGSDAGIKTGMPVVTSAGVVGKITEVGKRKAKVMLVNDPNFSVAATLQRTREEGLLTGTLQGACRLRYLSHQTDVAPGDLVITSKISTTFPEGLVLGEVSFVEESPSSPTLECFIEPVVTLSQLEEVIVIKK